MAQRFLLPCTQCDQKIAVETTQAGQTVRCSGCKTDVKVGTLRDIKALSSADPAGGSSEAGSRGRAVEKAKMSTGNRLLFVAGSLLLAIGLVWGVTSTINAMHLSGYKLAEPLSPQKEKQLVAYLKTVPPADLLKMWDKNVNEDDLAEWVEHPSLRAQRFARQKKVLSWVGFGVAGLGLIGIVASIMGGGGRNERPT